MFRKKLRIATVEFSISVLIPSLLIFFSVFQVWAGGWVFGGGDQIGDTHNPWFLKTESQIRYCIELDGSTFSASHGQAKEVVAQALEYWRSDFAKLEKLIATSLAASEPGPTAIRSATQGFAIVPCHENPELRFVLGQGHLSEAELKYVEPFNLIAGAIRTEYNSLHKKGRGFVYLASDLGSHSFVKPSQVDKPWSRPGLLYRVLVHEIGHIFGLQHSQRGVMRADYPETILQTKNSPAFQNLNNLPSSLLPELNTLTLADASIANVERSIKVYQGVQQLLTPDVVALPSSVTLEWSLAVKTPSGETKPLMIRSSPFSYETYSLVDGKIKNTRREEKQCRPDFCFSD
jgi:hypothetical protein